jgi:hypothetical protein
MQTRTLDLAIEGCRWRFPPLDDVIADADHIDIKTIDGERTLREFVAGMMAYQPSWVTFLYRVRAVFVRFLGMRQEGIPQAIRMTPEDVPMTGGEKVGFFEVLSAKEPEYLCIFVTEKHLTAHLAIVCEAISPTTNRFYVLTVVHYNHWTGIIYFNVIRPFHHWVVNGMVRAGICG